MLDAYIIEKIKREEERRDSDRMPLRIEQTPKRERPRPSCPDDHDERPERGVVIIDF